MIIWIILLLLFIPSIIGAYEAAQDFDTLWLLLLSVFYWICLLCAIVLTIEPHVTAGAQIEKANVAYEDLTHRIEAQAADETIDTVLYSDIQSWNMSITEVKYWTYNAWTSWFNSKAYADSLNYISIEEVIDNK